MNCAVYARKSNEQNGVADEAKSVGRQIEPARAYAASKGWTVADEHVYGSRWSARISANASGSVGARWRNSRRWTRDRDCERPRATSAATQLRLLDDWRGLLGKHVGTSRQLRKVLDRQRFVFYPMARGKARWYDLGVRRRWRGSSGRCRLSKKRWRPHREPHHAGRCPSEEISARPKTA